ncbi:tRNA pseudouridine(55) synthase TruB [soil metagenome]
MLDGIIVVNKPPGPTSHDIVALVRRLTGVRRVGHGGTLDPFAAGVLPVFVGRATRVVEYHMADEKAYRTLVVFGARSTTDDLDGELTPGEGTSPNRDVAEAALADFRGQLTQVPPTYSAVRVSGRRAYELARHGQRPELQPRQVEIRELSLTDWSDADPERPTATLEVRCSAGTYIRALARDLGERLGCGAYLAQLTRTASGPFRLEDARELDELRTVLGDGRAAQVLLPVDTGLDAYPPVRLAPEELVALSRGQIVRPRGASGIDYHADGERVRIVGTDGRLAAVARVQGGRLHPEKVLLAAGG